jgi:hypothetical protein
MYLVPSAARRSPNLGALPSLMRSASGGIFIPVRTLPVRAPQPVTLLPLPSQRPINPIFSVGAATPGLRLSPLCPGGAFSSAGGCADGSVPQWPGIPPGTTPPPVIIPQAPPPASGTGPGAAAPPPSANPGTPVPAGYPTNQFYVNNADGSVWEYSASKGGWINTGTPYNVGAPPSPAATPANPYAGTPVPPGYPDNQPYYAADGSVWQYSIATGTFLQTAPAASSSGGSAAFPSGGGSPASISVTSPAAASSGYQAILDWLEQSTLITNVPNWITALGAALIFYKGSQMATGKR